VLKSVNKGTSRRPAPSPSRREAPDGSILLLSAFDDERRPGPRVDGSVDRLHRPHDPQPNPHHDRRLASRVEPPQERPNRRLLGRGQSLMTLFRYAIVRVNRHWQIVSDRKRIGLFLTAYQAAKTAAGLAREAQQSGHEVEI